MRKEETSEKILVAAMTLFSQRGYNTVTTKEIAQEAGISEMTLFRHFESKRNLFEKAYDKYLFSPKFKSFFNSLEWDLEKDMLKFSSIYQEILTKNEKIILMHIQDREILSDFDSPMFKFPNDVRILLSNYFNKMTQKGIVKENPEVIAVNFLATNLGLFLFFTFLGKYLTDIDKENCISTQVRVFIKGITK